MPLSRAQPCPTRARSLNSAHAPHATTSSITIHPRRQDFYNLVDVYLDAVLHPKCVSDRRTFEQEGWHLELDDPAEPLTYKGVVFNEMKGVYSSPDSMFYRTVQQVRQNRTVARGWNSQWALRARKRSICCCLGVRLRRSRLLGAALQH